MSQRSLHTDQPPDEPFPSEARQHRDWLYTSDPPAKWGLNIYRTAYNTPSSAIYPRFKTFMQRQLLKSLENSTYEDPPELRNELLSLAAWDFHDDSTGHAQVLNGMTVGELCSHFKSWVEREPAPTPADQPADRKLWDPRFLFFLFVDEECLTNFSRVVGGGEVPTPGTDGGGGGDDFDRLTYSQSEEIFVKLGEANFEENRVRLMENYETDIRSARTPAERQRIERSRRSYFDECEPIDGLRDEIVGWMKVTVPSLSPSIYYDLLDYEWRWDKIYVRPPGVYRLP